MDRLSRIGMIVIMMLGLMAPASASGQEGEPQDAAPRLVEVSPTGLIFELDVASPKLEEVQVDGQTFQRLSLPGYTAAGAAGQPELLQTGVLLGMPAEGSVQLRILDAQVETLPGSYTLYPVPQQVVQRDPQSGEADAVAGVQEQFTWDRAAYANDQFQPEAVVSLDETAFMRDQRVARVLIQPVQYNPAQGTLKVYRWLRVEATFDGATSDAPADASAAAGPFDALLQAQLLNFDQAQAWRTGRGEPLSSGHAPESVYPGDTSRTWFKTTLRASGLYKITLAELQGAELAPLAAANPAYLQVWTHGQQVAAHFVGDGDAQFEPGEALLFYADIQPTIYSETDVYWLSVGNTPGLRMAPSNAAPAGAATDTAAWATARLEEDYIYKGDLPGYGIATSYPRWYWKELSTLFTPSYTVYQTLPTANTSGYTARVRVRMQGSSFVAAVNPDHRVRVELNGQAIGVMTWDGLIPAQSEFQVSSALLRRGLNSVTLTLEAISGVVNDSTLLDWVEIDYQHALQTVNDQALFAAAAGGQREFRVQGFSGQDVLAFDVTNPAAVTRLTGWQATPMDAPDAAPEGAASAAASATSQYQVYLPIAGALGSAGSASYQVRFGVASATPRRYALTRLAATPPIAALSRDGGSNLHSTGNRADYLLVSHSSLWPAAEALASHRRARGLTVTLVEIQDIYDEFSNGRMDPRAIRDFTAYAYANWQRPAPAYLMLLGSAHYDYRMRTGLASQPILVPTYFGCADPFTCEVAVENEFVAISGSDRMPDLALGRLPARNLAEATLMVNKAISYETAPPTGAWRSTLTFVADNYRAADGTPDPAGNFEALSNGTIALVPPQYVSNRIFYDPYPNDDGGEPYRYRTAAAATTAIVTSVNTGTVFLNYIGHAGVTTWAHEALLRMRDVGRNDVTLLNNGGRLPIVLDMACASGNFADPQQTGLEVMMLGRSGGGSAAGWAATGFGVATGHDQLHRGFYQSVFGGQRVLGLATAAGKQALWSTGSNLDLLDTFDLLGDPALRINLP